MDLEYLQISFMTFPATIVQIEMGRAGVSNLFCDRIKFASLYNINGTNYLLCCL